MPLDGFDTLISWSGFQNLPGRPAGADTDAETMARYRAPKINFVGKGKAVGVDSADVEIRFRSEESWVVQGKQTNYLLNHEQGHYDITALGAREYHKNLFTLTANDSKSLQEKINKLDASFIKKISVVNKRYDAQTDHSQKKAEQDKWDKAIAAEKQKSDGSLDNLP